jgi:hypothetical protein
VACALSYDVLDAVVVGAVHPTVATVVDTELVVRLVGALGILSEVSFVASYPYDPP